MLTTFEAFAARAHVDVLAWEARVGGVVDRDERDEQGRLQFTKFVVEIDMEVTDVVLAQTTLAEAKQHCLIANALGAPVDVEAKIRPATHKAG
jgi:organic hydroperoxide reductase OsmC/OhrA